MEKSRKIYAMADHEFLNRLRKEADIAQEFMLEAESDLAFAKEFMPNLVSRFIMRAAVARVRYKSFQEILGEAPHPTMIPPESAESSVPPPIPRACPDREHVVRSARPTSAEGLRRGGPR